MDFLDDGTKSSILSLAFRNPILPLQRFWIRGKFLNTRNRSLKCHRRRIQPLLLLLRG
jgi:hypothetical protein